MLTLKSVAAAQRVLDELRIYSTEDLRLLELIAQERGAIVDGDHLRGADARLSFGPTGQAYISVRAGVDPARRRFSIAHELGHLELQHGRSTVCTEDDVAFNGSRSSNRESEANVFAAHLLLPERFVVPRCRGIEPSIKFIQQLAAEFQTSFLATAIRYADVASESCAIVYCKNGRVSWVAPSDDFRNSPWFIPAHFPVDEHSVLVWCLKEGRTMWREAADADSWIEGVEGELTEDVFVFADGSALVLLWLTDELQKRRY